MVIHWRVFRTISSLHGRYMSGPYQALRRYRWMAHTLTRASTTTTLSSEIMTRCLSVTVWIWAWSGARRTWKAAYGCSLITSQTKPTSVNWGRQTTTTTSACRVPCSAKERLASTFNANSVANPALERQKTPLRRGFLFLISDWSRSEEWIS